MTVAFLPTLAQSACGLCPLSFSDSSDDDGGSRPGDAPGADPADRRKSGRRSDYVDALAAQLGTPTTAQIINRAEDNVAPGSHAFARREQMGQAGARAAQTQQDFKQALQQARQSQARPEPVKAPLPTAPLPEPENQAAKPTVAEEQPTEQAKPAMEAARPAQPKPAPATPTSVKPDSPPPTGKMQSSATPTSPLITSSSPVANGRAQNGANAQATTPSTPSGSVAAISAIAPSNESASAGTGNSESNSSTAAIGPVSKPDTGASPKVAAPQAATPAEPDDERASNIERIVQLVRSKQVSDKTSATLRLDPPHLGTLKLHMDLEQEKLALRMEPQTSAAHQMLSQHLDALRSGLEAAGIQLVQVQIVPPAAPMDGHDAQAFLNANARGRQGGGADEKRMRRSAGTGPAIEGVSGPPAMADASMSAAEPRVNLVA